MPDGREEQQAALEAAFAGLPDDFGFFRDVYTREILPGLVGREAERRQAADDSKRWTLIGAGVALALGAVSLIAFRSAVGLFLGGIAGMGLHEYGRSSLKRLSKEAKVAIVTEVARGFALDFTVDPMAPPVISRFRTLGLLPGWDRSHFEDQLVGKRAETDFEFFEAHLEDRRTTTDSKGHTRTRYVTVFRGQCLVVRFPKTFHGLTVVQRDAGLFNAIAGMGRKGERVRLEDPRFEKAFEVYSTDQIEARFLLTPDFMERLLEIEETFRGGKLRCAFSAGELFLCVEGGDLFEPGSMFTPLDNPARVRELMLDFAAVFGLIDTASNRARKLPA